MKTVEITSTYIKFLDEGITKYAYYKRLEFLDRDTMYISEKEPRVISKFVDGQLLMDYWNLRDSVLDALYKKQQAIKGLEEYQYTTSWTRGVV